MPHNVFDTSLAKYSNICKLELILWWALYISLKSDKSCKQCITQAYPTFHFRIAFIKYTYFRIWSLQVEMEAFIKFSKLGGSQMTKYGYNRAGIQSISVWQFMLILVNNGYNNACH